MREIPVADNLTADVEGDIEDIDGIPRITNIRLVYRLRAPAGSRDKVQRALEVYAEKCPAYMSIKGCINCSWTVELDSPK